VSGQPLTFYEFFAGGGMARLGLGAPWTCAFANDFWLAAIYRVSCRLMRINREHAGQIS
jgi:hypothetical protein